MRLYEKLGVKTSITCGGNGTANGGSIMFPEVLEAMADASRPFHGIGRPMKVGKAACDELRQGEPGIIVPALRTGMLVSWSRRSAWSREKW